MQDIISISYVIHYSNTNLMNNLIQVTNNEHIMTHYFHDEGIVTHNSIFIIVNNIVHCQVALYPIEANQV